MGRKNSQEAAEQQRRTAEDQQQRSNDCSFSIRVVHLLLVLLLLRLPAAKGASRPPESYVMHLRTYDLKQTSVPTCRPLYQDYNTARNVRYLYTRWLSPIRCGS